MKLEYIKCACGGPVVVDRIMVTQGSKPMIQVGTANICPDCKKVISVNTSGGHKLEITQYQLERVYRVGINAFTLAEITEPLSSKSKIGLAPELPRSNYNPNAYIERERNEEIF